MFLERSGNDYLSCINGGQNSLGSGKPFVNRLHRNLKSVPLSKWKIPIVINTNARSLIPKLDELKTLSENTGADIMCITETWCRENIPDCHLNLEPYTILRRDRQCSTGGGVVAYV